MDALDRLALCLSSPHLVMRMDSTDHQNVVLELDFTRNLGDEIPLAGFDLASLQRTAEGSGQSTASGGNHIIQCRCVRWRVPGRNLVVFGDL